MSKGRLLMVTGQDIVDDRATDASGAPTPPSAEPAPSVQEAVLRLDRSVRALRGWLITATILLVLVTLAGSVAAAISLTGVYSLYRQAIGNTTATDPAAIEKQIRSSLGTNLESVTVYPVAVNAQEGDLAPLPFLSAPSGAAVTYRVKGAGVAVAGVVTGEDQLTDVGLLPVDYSSADDFLSLAEFQALAREWTRHSKAPIGGVYRYDNERFAPNTDQIPTSAKIDGKTYDVTGLWRVFEGQPVGPGARYAPNLALPSLVFSLDPESGRFTYLRTEQTPDSAATSTAQ